jgi:hypothetical protein
MSVPLGLPRVGSSPAEKIFSVSPARADRLKIFTLNRKVTFSFSLNWICSERVHLHNRQIMILSRKTKTYATHSGPGPLSGQPGTVNFYCPPPPPPLSWHCVSFKNCNIVHIRGNENFMQVQTRIIREEETTES